MIPSFSDFIFNTRHIASYSTKILQDVATLSFLKMKKVAKSSSVELFLTKPKTSCLIPLTSLLVASSLYKFAKEEIILK